MASGKSRNWCFTWNNPEGSMEEFLERLGTYKYCCIGSEVGESGTHHWQGYVDFVNPRVLGGCKKINKAIHWEIRRGTWKEATDYCKKDDVWFEWGTPPEPGARNDIKRMVDSIAEGADDADLLMEHGDKALRIMGCIGKARCALREVMRDWVMDVRIYWGAPDSGKTRSVWEEFGVRNVYPKMVGKWWDHYQGQQCVLIDDFDPEACFDITFGYYLKLLDRYPMWVECKGGSMQFCSKVIIFTSNFDPETWFVGRGNREAFFRRVTVIKEHGTEVWQGNTVPATVATLPPTYGGILPI